MKTLKITLVATVATTVAWWLGIAHRMWPAHPYLANSLVALICCLVLRVAWPESKKASPDQS